MVQARSKMVSSSRAASLQHGHRAVSEDEMRGKREEASHVWRVQCQGQVNETSIERSKHKLTC